jgi:Subtilase family
MTQMRKTLAALAVATLGISGLSLPALGEGLNYGADAGRKGGGTTPTSGCSLTGASGPWYCWMSTEVQGAWTAGYKGAGVAMTFVDDYSSADAFAGNLGDGTKTLLHGEWTRKEALMLAPEATAYRDDFNTESAVVLQPGQLNVLNLSFTFGGAASFYSSSFNWSAYPQEQSIIAAARDGTAVIAKSAGNDAVAVGTAKRGVLDFLGTALIGTQSNIFVGSLDFNGTVAKKAPLSYYSNFAGSNLDVQNHFLVVGVDYKATGLAGTSFAAPVIAGYSAVLGSKFGSASPTQIANRLLSTARIDTILNYSRAVHGMGEASLANALAPNTIQ